MKKDLIFRISVESGGFAEQYQKVIAIEEIKDLLHRIVKTDISILITDHNVRETLSLCNKAIIMDSGKVIAEGNKDQLIANDLVTKTYLGNMYS